MKYKVDVIITNKNTYKQRHITEYINDNRKAYERKEELLNSMSKDEYSHWSKCIPVVKCDCGEEVECYNFTNTCDCGADYNFCGDLLADRSLWGEETGESWQECY